MSSEQSTPYTIPYTGATGKQVADSFVPASSMEPGAVAQPAAPQDNNHQQPFQRPAVAEQPSAANIGYSKGETKIMVSGSGVTSNTNSGSRRSSLVPTTPTGPSDSIPGRFASASAGSDGIATIRPEHRGFNDIHSSQVKEDKVSKTQGYQGTASFGLDGSSNIWTTPTQDHSSGRNASPMLIRELQALRLENQQLRHMNHTANVAGYQWYSMWVKNANEVNELKCSTTALTNIILRLNSKIKQMDPDVYCNLPDDLKFVLQEIHEEWKYDEWYKAFVDPASDDYIPFNSVDCDLEKEMDGLDIHDDSSHASSA